MAELNRARRMAQSAESTAESAQDAVMSMASDVRDNIADVGASVTRTAQDAIGSVSRRMKDAGVDPDVMADAAKKQASKLQQAVEEELRERPVRTLAIAAAVGLFVGLMTTR